MKVMDGCKGVTPGTVIPLEQLGLPASGHNGLLIVFWKST
jgi:hypothetical protein